MRGGNRFIRDLRRFREDLRSQGAWSTTLKCIAMALREVQLPRIGAQGANANFYF